MGPTKISGLPAHILLVHLVVVLLPVAAVVVLVAGVWPAARWRLRWIAPLLALVALACVPVTVHAGEWLQARVGATPLVAKHAHLGHQMLPWALGLFAAAVIVAVFAHLEARRSRSRPAGLSVRIVVGLVAVVAAVGVTQQVYRTGESGSRAVWTNSFSQQPLH